MKLRSSGLSSTCTILSWFIGKNLVFMWCTVAKKQLFRSNISVLELLVSSCAWAPAEQAVIAGSLGKVTMCAERKAGWLAWGEAAVDRITA